MSAKQLRRYLEVTGRLKNEEELLRAGLNSESDEECDEEEPCIKNRFAFLEEDKEENKESGENEESADGEGEELKNRKSEDVVGRSADGNEAVKGKKGRKKNRKKKKKGKDEGNCDAEFVVNTSENDVSRPLGSADTEGVFERDIFKVDTRRFNYENELRRLVGQKPIESTSRNHRRGPTGRIVKKKATWPEVKNVGISMELDRVEGEVEWYKFSHNPHYRQLQQTFWEAADAIDQNAIMAILQECPYHLDSLLVMANVMRNQEEHRMARDFIERGIFCCESVFAARFHLHDFNHRIDYKDLENRAFFLLLHRHMRTLMERSLVETAFNVAKLIYRLEPENDPLAILLIIDSLAIRAQQPRVLFQIAEAMHSSRRLERLPNFAYSIALAHFQISLESGDRRLADHYLSLAIRHFPTLVLQLLDKLNVQPDTALENNTKMSGLAHQRRGIAPTGKAKRGEGWSVEEELENGKEFHEEESEGIKLLTSIYVAHTHDLWRESSVLKWLEEVTAFTMTTFEDYADEMAEWQTIRNTLYIGIPRNVRRHALLWDLEHSTDSILTDPVPPLLSRSAYARAPRPLARPVNSFVLNLMQSLFPDMDQVERIGEVVGDLANMARHYIYRNDGSAAREEEHRPPDEPR